MGDVSAETEGIRIDVSCQYSENESAPLRQHWFFIYTIRIRNNGETPAKLLNRHWEITNANGEVSHVRGPGVVGEQPLLRPGEAFEYRSACPLDTPFGTMRGTYEMERPDGTHFDATVPEFILMQPHAVN